MSKEILEKDKIFCRDCRYLERPDMCKAPQNTKLILSCIEGAIDFNKKNCKAINGNYDCNYHKVK